METDGADVVTGAVTLGGVHPDLAQEIGELAQRRGRPLTLDEAVRLRTRHEALRSAYSQARGAAVERDGLLPRTVRVGSVTLRQLTLGARMTLRRLLAWNEQSPDLYDQDAWDTLQAYVFAHSFDAEALGRLSDPEQAAAVAMAWGSALNCSTRALNAAVATLTGVAGPEASGAGSQDEAALVDSLMCRYAGTDPERWLFGLPETALAHLVDGANRNDREAAAAAARARGELPPPDADGRIDASAEWLAERERIAAAGAANKPQPGDQAGPPDPPVNGTAAGAAEYSHGAAAAPSAGRSTAGENEPRTDEGSGPAPAGRPSETLNG